MPGYISAYDLQQRDSLTRQEILALAEAGPAFVRNGGFGSYNPEATVAHREYNENGFEGLKRMIASDWSNLARRCAETAKDRWNDYVCERFPDIISGETAYKLLGGVCPQEIQKNLSSNYTMRQIVNMMDGGHMINLFEIPEQWGVSGETIWAYLSRQPGIDIDLFFERIFKEDLFFDQGHAAQAKGVCRMISVGLSFVHRGSFLKCFGEDFGKRCGWFVVLSP
jgi:hypothetical protein